MANTSNIVVQQLTDGIARIKLNEPTTYNSLSSKTLKSLINIFKSLNKDNKTKVIIIEGSGKDLVRVMI
jgi:enoyl-CoA hydratase/carnithine racemase